MNLDELVWDFNIPLNTKLDLLSKKMLELDKQITNRKKLTFDLYHKFPKNLDLIKTKNNQWKEICLAIQIVKIVKRWNRRYHINTNIVKSGQVFIDFFHDSVNCSKFNLCSIGINFYHREGYTFKTFILWANKLCKLGIIGNEKYNNFMKYLEENSNGK